MNAYSLLGAILIILNLIFYTVSIGIIYFDQKHILIWPILIYRVNSWPYKFLVLGRRTCFYITGIFIYLSPSKNQMTIVRNEIYLYTSRNTKKRSFYGQNICFKNPRTYIRSSIPPRTFFPRRTYFASQNRSHPRSLSYLWYLSQHVHIKKPVMCIIPKFLTIDEHSFSDIPYFIQV